MVLGSSGLLGTAVTRLLAERPIRLRAVGRRETAVPAGCRAEVEVRTADLTEGANLAEAVAGADAIVHLVAHIAGPGTWRVAEGDKVAERVNVGLVHDLIEVAGNRARPPIVVFAGSMSQAGKAMAESADGSVPDQPLTEYDKQKLAAEQALEAATERGLVRGTTLRLATLFGQGTDPTHLDRGVVAAMNRRAWAGQPLTMWHDGTVKRDLLCVDDAARAFLAALDHPEVVSGRHWLVGSGNVISIGELFHTIAKAVSAVSGEPPVPVISVPPADHSTETDMLDFALDPSAFQAAVGWRPREPLQEALERTAVAFAGEK
ncbi:NAD-dependent epimerase/dehydratase [Herbidospora galbida]|uniref:NAD-dependent epimerase/dehydratase n=1 Tax=Herbidospora galbida TaxID=2575442 RepID=A0A4U3LWM8_9ACTN|nr:NAD-dependent epimerase/dehydratase [Herbidospora galbida]